MFRSKQHQCPLFIYPYIFAESETPQDSALTQSAPGNNTSERSSQFLSVDYNAIACLGSQCLQ